MCYIKILFKTGNYKLVKHKGLIAAHLYSIIKPEGKKTKKKTRSAHKTQCSVPAGGLEHCLAHIFYSSSNVPTCDAVGSVQCIIRSCVVIQTFSFFYYFKKEIPTH